MSAACNVLKTHLCDPKAVSSKDMVRTFSSAWYCDVLKLYCMKLGNNSPSCLLREPVWTRCSTSGFVCPARRRRWGPWWMTIWGPSRTSRQPCCATSSTWPTATGTLRCTTACPTPTFRWWRSCWMQVRRNNLAWRQIIQQIWFKKAFLHVTKKPSLTFALCWGYYIIWKPWAENLFSLLAD